MRTVGHTDVFVYFSPKISSWLPPRTPTKIWVGSLVGTRTQCGACVMCIPFVDLQVPWFRSTTQPILLAASGICARPLGVAPRPGIIHVRAWWGDGGRVDPAFSHTRKFLLVSSVGVGRRGVYSPPVQRGKGLLASFRLRWASLRSPTRNHAHQTRPHRGIQVLQGQNVPGRLLRGPQRHW